MRVVVEVHKNDKDEEVFEKCINFSAYLVTWAMDFSYHFDTNKTRGIFVITDSGNSNYDTIKEWLDSECSDEVIPMSNFCTILGDE